MATFADLIKNMIDGRPDLAAVTDTPVVHTFYCRSCSDFTKVDAAGDLCPACTMERARGYQALTKTGRRANGAQRDHGTKVHAVRFGEYAAVCGTEPGRRADWSTPYKTRDVTCPRCLARLAKVQPKPDYCDCENCIPTGTAPVVCLKCHRYVDPARVVPNGNGYEVRS